MRKKWRNSILQQKACLLQNSQTLAKLSLTFKHTSFAFLVLNQPLVFAFFFHFQFRFSTSSSNYTASKESDMLFLCE